MPNDVCVFPCFVVVQRKGVGEEKIHVRVQAPKCQNAAHVARDEELKGDVVYLGSESNDLQRPNAEDDQLEDV